MQLKLTQTDCGGQQLIVVQEQGENSPIVMTFPYNVGDWDFEGTINFNPPLALAIDSGIEILSIAEAVATITNNVLTVASVTSGTLYIGMPVYGETVLPGTVITGFGSGTGGTGTYYVNKGQTAAQFTFSASRVAIQLTPEQTQDVPEGQYKFDFWSITPDVTPVNNVVINGYFEINKALTVIS